MILNEYEIAEQILALKKISKKSDLFIVAKYLRHEGNCDETETFAMLNSIMSKSDKNFNPVKSSNYLAKISKKAKEYELNKIENIHITQKELEVIAKLNNPKQERLLFSLLCYAKYNNSLSEDNNDWCNVGISELFKTAKVSTRNSKEKALHINLLKNNDFIKLSCKNTNLNMRCQFVDEKNHDDDIILTDFRELGYQYINIRDKTQFTHCEKCGLIIKKKDKNGNTPRYCRNCYNEKRIVQKRNSFAKLDKSNISSNS